MLTSEDLKEITRVEEQALNRSTTKQTKNHVNELRIFLESKKLPNTIEKIPPKYLCQYLRQWFSTMKKRDGDFYSLSTLACKRASIHRFLQENANYKLIGNEEFRLFESKKSQHRFRRKMVLNVCVFIVNSKLK